MAQTAHKKVVQWLQKAVLHHQRGELQKAVESYSRYLEHDRDNAEILHTLGGLHYELRDYPQACACLQRAHELAPDNPDYLNDLGALYLGLKDYTNAVQCLNKLLESMPDNAQAHYNLGLALYGAECMPEAIGSFEKAVHLKPDYVEAWHNLGMAYHAIGRLRQAEKAYGSAVQLEPGLAQTHFRRGVILLELKCYKSALRSLQRAHELDSKNLKVIQALAEALENNGDRKGAMALLRGVLAEHPQQVWAMLVLARLLDTAGQFEESQALYRQVLTFRHDNYIANAYLSYSRTRKFNYVADNEIISSMEQILADVNIHDNGRLLLNFALGKILDDCGEYDAAFYHYQEGNTIRHKQINYNRSAHENTINALIDIFSPDFFTEFSALGTEEELPIIIAGLSRSGKSMTEQSITNRARVVAAGGEIAYFTRLSQYLLESNVIWPFCYQSLNKEFAINIIRQYLEILLEYTDTARLVTDTSPGNYLELGLIRLLFPKAPIIHCRRQPLDLCLETYFKTYENYQYYNYAYSLEDIGHYYLQYARLMAHWRRVLPGPYFESQYEDLTGNHEAHSRRLIEFCGLECDDAQMEASLPGANNTKLHSGRQPVNNRFVNFSMHYDKYLQPLKEIFRGAVHEM